MTDESNGLPRERRLASPAAFRHVFENAQKSSDTYFTVLARVSDRGYSRLGLAVSKKNLRNAVDRNRIKRLVRESFRLRKAELGSVDYVVMARAAVKEADRKTLDSALERHWKILKKKCDSCLSGLSSSTGM